jgi:hypothetical protein
LLDFRAGDAETGKGSQLDDDAVIRFAKACPNLVHVGIDGGIRLTDESLVAFLTNCPNLRYIQLSGNDKAAGKLRGTALDLLRERPDLGKKLVKLRLTDQAEFDKTFMTAVKSLSRARKWLAIEIGNTHERYGGVNTWLSGKEIYGYQALDGPGGFDSYGGYGGPF